MERAARSINTTESATMRRCKDKIIMLEIFTNGQLTDLCLDTEVTFTYEQPLFSDDRVVAPYTFSYELPLSPRNRALFGYPDRAASNTSFQKIPSEIRFAGLVIASGTQQIDEVSDRLSVNFVGADFPMGNRKYLYNLSLGKLDLGVAEDQYRREWTTTQSKIACETALQQWALAGDTLVAPPVGIKNVEFPAAEQYSFNRQNNLFINSFCSSYLQTLTKPTGVEGNTVRVTHLSKILPVFRVGWLFRILFGGMLQNNIFDSETWRPLVLLGRWHPKYQTADDYPVWNINSETGAVSITFQDFLPKVQANDFITNMLKIPCASMYPIGSQFVIETNADILSGASDVRVWDDKLIGIPSISIEEGKEYECGYNGDEGTVPDDIIPVKVQTIEDMFRDALAGDELKTYQIESTGQIIESQFDTEMGNRYKFRVVRQSMGGEDKTGDDDPEKDEKSSYDAKVNGTVLWTNLRAIINTDTIATRVFQYVPEGEAIEEDRPDTLTVGLFWGYRNQLYENESSVSDTYPYMSHCNYDGEGNRLGDATLRFDGTDGLLARFHSRFKAWVEKDKRLLTAEVLLTARDLSRMDLRRKIAIRNKLYLIKTLSVTLTPRRILPAEVELVEC